MFHLRLLAALALIVVYAMYKVHMQAQGAPILSAHALIKVVVLLVWNSSGSSRGTEGVMPPGPVKISHKKDYHSCFSSPPPYPAARSVTVEYPYPALRIINYRTNAAYFRHIAR